MHYLARASLQYDGVCLAASQSMTTDGSVFQLKAYRKLAPLVCAVHIAA
jgi:hypothetical protein